jgi:outer membrane receptor protein involved in Fe transport
LGKGFLFDTRTNIVGSRHLISDFANSAGRLGCYYTVDAKLSYTWKGFKAFVGVNNVFDTKYEEFATLVAGTQSFFPSPERNWITGLSYAF